MSLLFGRILSERERVSGGHPRKVADKSGAADCESGERSRGGGRRAGKAEGGSGRGEGKRETEVGRRKWEGKMGRGWWWKGREQKR